MRGREVALESESQHTALSKFTVFLRLRSLPGLLGLATGFLLQLRSAAMPHAFRRQGIAPNSAPFAARCRSRRACLSRRPRFTTVAGHRISLSLSRSTYSSGRSAV